MKSIGMTDEGVNAMRPNQTSTAKSMFDAAGTVDSKESLNKRLASSYDTQKDIVHYLEINEYL